jgi:hypothetical protein
VTAILDLVVFRQSDANTFFFVSTKLEPKNTEIIFQDLYLEMSSNVDEDYYTENIDEKISNNLESACIKLKSVKDEKQRLFFEDLPREETRFCFNHLIKSQLVFSGCVVEAVMVSRFYHFLNHDCLPRDTERYNPTNILKEALTKISLGGSEHSSLSCDQILNVGGPTGEPSTEVHDQLLEVGSVGGELSSEVPDQSLVVSGPSCKPSSELHDHVREISSAGGEQQLLSEGHDQPLEVRGPSDGPSSEMLDQTHDAGGAGREQPLSEVQDQPLEVGGPSDGPSSDVLVQVREIGSAGGEQQLLSEVHDQPLAVGGSCSCVPW